jgi:hypothetical protein
MDPDIGEPFERWEVTPTEEPVIHPEEPYHEPTREPAKEPVKEPAR